MTYFITYGGGTYDGMDLSQVWQVLIEDEIGDKRRSERWLALFEIAAWQTSVSLRKGLQVHSRYYGPFQVIA